MIPEKKIYMNIIAFNVIYNFIVDKFSLNLFDVQNMARKFISEC
jgi:hypothetical protein